MPLTCEELKQHPEYPHVIWELEPTKKGLLPVAKGRGGPINIAWEVHGHGPRLLVFIMGMGGMRHAWQRQTKDFGHTMGDKYTALIFDNRGVGRSDKPWLRYSTSEMALDAIELVDHLGWTAPRSLHIIGISMGGMIAQELALKIPERIATLNLISTASYLVNTQSWWDHIKQRVGIFTPKSLETAVANAKRNMYSDPWLEEPDVLESVVEPFPTNGDRASAYEMRKRTKEENFTAATAFLQAPATGWHHKSKEQLTELADKVGRDRILVMHGGKDRLLSRPHAVTLLEGLNAGAKEGEEVRSEIWEDQGHVIPIEKRVQFREMIAEAVEKWHTL